MAADVPCPCLIICEKIHPIHVVYCLSCPCTATLCLCFIGEAYLFPNPKFHHWTRERGSQMRSSSGIQGCSRVSYRSMVEFLPRMCMVLGTASTEKFPSISLTFTSFPFSTHSLKRCGGVLGRNILLTATLRTPRTGLLCCQYLPTQFKGLTGYPGT